MRILAGVAGAGDVAVVAGAIHVRFPLRGSDNFSVRVGCINPSTLPWGATLRLSIQAREPLCEDIGVRCEENFVEGLSMMKIKSMDRRREPLRPRCTAWRQMIHRPAVHSATEPAARGWTPFTTITTSACGSFPPGATKSPLVFLVARTAVPCPIPRTSRRARYLAITAHGVRARCGTRITRLTKG